ncbi:hypothetical protein [Glaciihabitans sp. UYNi722]|uniref:hypothetical protein n=1 Tax=Glaciihabitans sp. UYNi722 TaxID=3156344 RepID=UPI003397268E
MKPLGEMLGRESKIIGLFQLYSVNNKVLRSGLEHWDLTGATATVDVGAQHKGVTAGRVVALGVLALAAKKDKTKVFVTVELASGEQVIIEGPASKEKQARQFAGIINQVAKL